MDRQSIFSDIGYDQKSKMFTEIEANIQTECQSDITSTSIGGDVELLRGSKNSSLFTSYLILKKFLVKNIDNIWRILFQKLVLFPELIFSAKIFTTSILLDSMSDS